MTTPASPRLGAGASILFAAGSLGTGVFTTVPTVLLLYYCTEVLGIAPVWASIIVFAPKAWSLIWDPLVGAWSDRAHGRFGRRRPFLAIGAVGVALAFVAVFAPQFEGAGVAIWTGVAYFLLASFYSLFAVPYTAIPAEIIADDQQRSRLISLRMTFLMLGVLLGAAAAPMIIASAGGGRPGYGVMAVVIGTAAGIALLAPVFMMKRFDPPRARPERSSPARRDAKGLPARLGPFAALSAAFLLQLTAMGAVSAATPYLVVQVLHRDEADVGLALGAYILVTIFTVPAWGWLGRRIGEIRALGIGAVLYGAAAILLGAGAQAGWSWPHMMIVFVVAGLPFAALQVLPFVLAARYIRGAASGGSAEGRLSGAWTATEKLGLALGPTLVGLMISAHIGGAGTAIVDVLRWIPMTLVLLSLAPLALAAALFERSAGRAATADG